MRQVQATPSQPSPAEKHPDFTFNLRELGGSLGDFGTLFPLAVAYIAVNGIDPAALSVMLGLTNIALGLSYLMRALRLRGVLPCLCIADDDGQSEDSGLSNQHLSSQPHKESRDE